MASSTVENYVKQIYLQEQAHSDELVPLGRLASVMNVVPGTATSMVKTLAEAGLVDYQPRAGIRLTAHGEKLALHVLRRHRLLEQFLVEVLHYDWSEVHQEAETLEHAVSDKLMEHIDDLLGNPQVDPHGDPIPNVQGQVSDPDYTPLSLAQAGEALEISRIIDQEPEFLRFLEKNQLTPGSKVAVMAFDTQASSITLKLANEDVLNLGLKAAVKILTHPTPQA
jgi:DtxR family Mn-dependent transcriptional regulator